jgi:hypothetical protein
VEVSCAKEQRHPASFAASLPGTQILGCGALAPLSMLHAYADREKYHASTVRKRAGPFLDSSAEGKFWMMLAILKMIGH